MPLLTNLQWQYFYPIQQGMPQNCSTDISLVIDYIDSVFSNGTADEIASLKGMFGLSGLEHNDDFGAVILDPLWDWQSISFSNGYNSGPFFHFCDAIENAVPGSSTTTPATGVGLEKALAGYANYVKTVVVPGCKSFPNLNDKGRQLTVRLYRLLQPH